jgi:hypothetical protein
MGSSGQCSQVMSIRRAESAYRACAVTAHYSRKEGRAHVPAVGLPTKGAGNFCAAVRPLRCRLCLAPKAAALVSGATEIKTFDTGK